MLTRTSYLYLLVVKKLVLTVLKLKTKKNNLKKIMKKNLLKHLVSL